MQEVGGCQPDKAVSSVFGKFSNKAERAVSRAYHGSLHPAASADGQCVLKARPRSPEPCKDLPQG